MWSVVKRLAALMMVFSIMMCAINVVRIWASGYRFSLPPHGTILGEVDGIQVFSANGGDDRGQFGLEYQCVELVNRVFVEKHGHRNLTQTGHADSYYWYAKEKGLVSYTNGGDVRPEPWDALVFDGGDSDGTVGHIAVISRVLDDRVEFIQQNFTSCQLFFVCRYNWQDSLPISRSGNGWSVHQGTYPQPVAGWSRPQLQETQ